MTRAGAPGSPPAVPRGGHLVNAQHRRLQGRSRQLHGYFADRECVYLPERDQAFAFHARLRDFRCGELRNERRGLVRGGFNGPYAIATAFGPNRSRRLAAFTDGLTQTLLAAEVKAYQTSSNCRFTTLPSVNDPNNIPSPYADPFTVAPEYDNGIPPRKPSKFHTESSDGHVHAAGSRRLGRPNKSIVGRSFYKGMELDLNGMNEENGGPTFSAINARSYHPGGTNTLLADGSVRFVKSAVDGMVSRLGTVAGGEVRISSDAY